MGTTSTGLRYPEPTDPVNQGATAIKNLATDVAGKYPTMQAGTQAITLAGGGVTASVVFPVPFAAIPKGVSVVTSAITGNAPTLISITALSATGLSVRVLQNGTPSYNGNLNLYWSAFL
jgi:hypothetical protein